MKRCQLQIISLLAMILFLVGVVGANAGERRSRRSNCIAGSCTTNTSVVTCTGDKCEVKKPAVAENTPAKPSTTTATTPKEATVIQTKTRVNRKERRASRSCSSCSG